MSVGWLSSLAGQADPRVGFLNAFSAVISHPFPSFPLQPRLTQMQFLPSPLVPGPPASPPAPHSSTVQVTDGKTFSGTQTRAQRWPGAGTAPRIFSPRIPRWSENWPPPLLPTDPSSQAGHSTGPSSLQPYCLSSSAACPLPPGGLLTIPLLSIICLLSPNSGKSSLTLPLPPVQVDSALH